MNKISVALATFNEQDNIGRCLESIASWVNEIIVVDGSSTDKTVEIAKKFKAKVILTNNPTNFHINKQKAIKACNGNWILQLDADEVVSDELKVEILANINQEPRTKNPALPAGRLEPINGFWIPRKNYFLGIFLKKGGQYPDYTLRLYRNGKGRLPAKNVHEQAQVDGEVGKLINPLLHFPYKDFSEYLIHFDRYTSIFAQELEEQKIKIGIVSSIKYCVFLPKYWFFLTFLRHKGFEDGFPGFVFSLFSSLRFPATYIKYWEKIKKNQWK